MRHFTSEDRMLGMESLQARHTLEAHLKKFWVSNDFSVAQDALLHPGIVTSVRVTLDKSLFPEMNMISLGMMKHLEISMRSCFAQSGIHILGNFFNVMSWDDIQQLQTEGRVDVEVPVINRGLADVQLKAGGAFFRLYFRPSGNSITGKKLYQLIKEDKLKVEGEYGTTRCLVGANNFELKTAEDFKRLDEYMEAKDLDESEVDQALTLKLKLNGNVYIPNNRRGIIIESKKNLVDILEPFDDQRKEHIQHNFNIGETFYVDFGDYFGAIIYQGYEGGGHHIISPLIDPGFKGPIRTEIVKGHEFNDFIELHIYHKDGWN